MQKQIQLNKKTFQNMEKDILNQVTEISKSVIETFKFKMLYGLQVSKKQNNRTINALKEFRSKNWNTKLSRNESYEKYLNLY